jgi:hypothetical protein
MFFVLIGNEVSKDAQSRVNLIDSRQIQSTMSYPASRNRASVRRRPEQENRMNMKEEFQAVPTDLHQLAEEAEASMIKGAGEANQRLAAGLDRIRGQAVERARAANLRLRKQAFLAATLSFGVGSLLGCLGSRLRLRRG